MITTLFDFHHVPNDPQQTRQAKRQGLRSASRRRLAGLLSQAGASSDRVIRDDNGLHPVDEQFYCSVSYTQNLVASAISHHAIGIDIEAISPRRDWRKIGKFLWRETPKSIEEFYFRFGVMEAWGKLRGIGIHSQSRRIHISDSTITSPDIPGTHWHFINLQQASYNFCMVVDAQYSKPKQLEALSHEITTQLGIATA
ncbi:4'-phosphopantetheinyl transferase family protein [Umboniibacter marinipuniceus]|uniref:Phosphopantetheinyl transferase n=1 Tax=Umboniibacter marinipuniceus TaxID=569599 RepID=A0A3M0ABD8_9GAMM|nr:hypothetical protein [Umboniibacter marinipuniceus]RMA82471.1 hypothetical protein DFR27_0420 [Umboniibacter marinipuniceus]